MWDAVEIISKGEGGGEHAMSPGFILCKAARPGPATDNVIMVMNDLPSTAPPNPSDNPSPHPPHSAVLIFSKPLRAYRIAAERRVRGRLNARVPRVREHGLIFDVSDTRAAAILNTLRHDWLWDIYGGRWPSPVTTFDIDHSALEFSKTGERTSISTGIRYHVPWTRDSRVLCLWESSPRQSRVVHIVKVTDNTRALLHRRPSKLLRQRIVKPDSIKMKMMLKENSSVFEAGNLAIFPEIIIVCFWLGLRVLNIFTAAVLTDVDETDAVMRLPQSTRQASQSAFEGGLLGKYRSIQVVFRERLDSSFHFPSKVRTDLVQSLLSTVYNAQGRGAADVQGHMTQQSAERCSANQN
ncbi:hypothetical protein J6590_035430 [Homalodisca vitripennis]|nr:hypothetical protein J6590_035430 [Homalodisca vitripennis]